MIAILNGRVLEKYNDSLVVGMGGIGFQVFVPRVLRERLRPGDEILLHTYLAVRQEALTLYGFESLEERQMFDLLLHVDGLGPRLALAILSTLSPQAIRQAVAQERAEMFTAVPGIGPKTARRIVLQLKDRLPAEEGLATAAPFSEVDAEVLAALTSLGYSVVEAQMALQSIPREVPQEVEARLRAALQYFA